MYTPGGEWHCENKVSCPRTQFAMSRPGFEHWPLKKGKKRSLVRLCKIMSFQQPVCCLRRTNDSLPSSTVYTCPLLTADWLLKAHNVKQPYQRTLFTLFTMNPGIGSSIFLLTTQLSTLTIRLLHLPRGGRRTKRQRKVKDGEESVFKDYKIALGRKKDYGRGEKKEKEKRHQKGWEGGELGS